MRRLLCWLGLHKWETTGKGFRKLVHYTRRCLWCGKTMEYDVRRGFH